VPENRWFRLRPATPRKITVAHKFPAAVGWRDL
jgi:hypothetical protein